MHELLLLRRVLQLVQRQLHVDLQQVREGLQHHQQLLLVYHLERLLNVSLHQIEEFSEPLLQFPPRFGVVVNVEIAVQLNQGGITSDTEL
jgi:hypothetical protein